MTQPEDQSLKEQFEHDRKNMHWLLRHWPSMRQLMKFATVGGITAVIDLGLFFLLRGLGIHFLVANLISVAIAIIINFILNRRWTFQRNNKAHFRRQFVEFFILNGVFYVLQQLLLFYGVALFPAPIFTVSSDIIIKLVVVFTLGVIKFFISKGWIFSQKRT
ncbi:GtrA family protein [Patescibacteria group bacterium]